MSFDALTVAAIVVIVALIAALVRVCTLMGNSCNGDNEYLARHNEESSEGQERSA